MYRGAREPLCIFIARLSRKLPTAPAAARQMRLHTAAYWLMLTLRDAIPKAHALAKPEFAAIRLRLIKLAHG
jgi:hypothetical protein